MLVFKFRTQSFSTLPSSVFIEENLFLQTLPIFCETTRLSLIMWISSKTTASLITEGEEGEVECWQWKQCLWSVPAPPQRRGYLTSPFKCSKASPPALLGTAFPHTALEAEGSFFIRVFGCFCCFLRAKSHLCPIKYIVFLTTLSTNTLSLWHCMLRQRNLMVILQYYSFSEKSWKKPEKLERGCGWENVVLRSIVDI